MSQSDDALRDLSEPVASTHKTGEQIIGAQQEARRLLYFARLMANSAGVPVWQLQRELPHGAGHITAQVAGPLALKKIHGKPQPHVPQAEIPNTPIDLVRLVWLPEGFVITPRNADNPKGWGMPPTKNPDGTQGWGTPGGPINQVIINRFKNNQYPDALYLQEVKKAGASEKDIQEIQEARKKGTLRICAANLFYMDWELLDDTNDPPNEKGFSIGMQLPDDSDPKNKTRKWSHKKMKWTAQFKKRFETNFSEPEDDKWYCHRPQHAFESGLQQYMRAQTNIIRNQAGKPPLNPPLRGTEGQLAESPLYMTKYSGVMGHDSYEFREGHISFDMRVQRAADGAAHGENIHAQQAPWADVTAVNTAVQWWKTSPGHYANMIKDWTLGDANSYWPSMDSAIRFLGEGAKVVKKQNPPYGLEASVSKINPPMQPVVAASQIFEGTEYWSGSPFTRGAVIRSILTANDYLFKQRKLPPFFTWRGRILNIGKDHQNHFSIFPLSCHEVMENGEVAKLRVAAKLMKHAGSGIYIVLFEGNISDFNENYKEIGRYFIDENKSRYFTNPVFSASGKKMAFMHDELKSTKYEESTHVLKEQTLHFVEFNEGQFNIVESESVPIHPEKLNVEYEYLTKPWGDKEEVIVQRSKKNAIKAIWRFLPVYNGESLEYIQCEVDNEYDIISNYSGFNFYNSPTEGIIQGNVKYFCKLVWPHGEEFVCYDIKSKPSVDFRKIESMNTNYLELQGFVRFLMTVDTTHPDMVSWVELNTNTELEAWAEVRIIAAGKTLKGPMIAKRSLVKMEKPDSIDARYMSTSICPFMNGTDSLYADSSQYGFGKITTSLNHIETPSGEHRAVLAIPALRDPRSATLIGQIDGTQGTRFRYTAIGPLIADSGDVFYNLPGKHDEVPATRRIFYYARYNNEWVFAGRASLPVGREQDTWTGDDKYYWASSLDLKSITGITDLSDNILPIGCIEGVHTHE